MQSSSEVIVTYQRQDNYNICTSVLYLQCNVYAIMIIKYEHL